MFRRNDCLSLKDDEGAEAMELIKIDTTFN